MKMESMAQFLITGDKILHQRKKYEVSNIKVNGENTTIIYKTQKTNVFRMLKVKSNEFFKIISPISLDK
jgi:ribosomal protein L25 (general stress protein Ctc)